MINLKGNLTKDLTQSYYTIHQNEQPYATKESFIQAMILQEFLDWTKRQWRVNAWWRGVKYNKSVGGVANSNHLNGTATDVSFGKGFNYKDKLSKYSAKWFAICDKYGVKGEFGLYPDFYHMGSCITYTRGGVVKHTLFDRRSGKTVYLN